MSLIAYGLIALAILGSLAGLYGTIHHSGVNEGRAEVQTKWEAAAKKARLAADAKNQENRKRKETADAENAKTRRDLAGLYDAYRSLRNQPRHGLVPPAPSGAASPATATFDREALNRGLETADGVLQEGAVRILQRGDAAIVDLDTARKWARP